MPSQIINSTTVFQGQDRSQSRGQPEVRVVRWRGPLAELELLLQGYGSAVDSYRLTGETGPMPSLEVSLLDYNRSTADAQAVQESIWELNSYQIDKPLRQNAYYADADMGQLDNIDDYLDNGNRDGWATLADLWAEYSTGKERDYLSRRIREKRDTYQATRWQIRQTILAARNTKLRPAVANVDKLATPPVPATALFVVSSLGGVWIKRAPQILGAGRNRYRLIQTWDHGTSEEYPTALFGT